MIKKELTCFECSFCGIKFDTEEECTKHEAMHYDIFNSEKTKFDRFVEELNRIEVKTNAAVTTTEKQTITKTVETEYEDHEDLDENGNPKIKTKTEEVTEEVDVPVTKIPEVYCAKCMRKIREDQTFVDAFGYTLCADCMIPVFKSFGKNYANFKSQFLTYMNAVNPHCSRFDVDDKGNIVILSGKSMIINKNCCSTVPEPEGGCGECKHYH